MKKTRKSLLLTLLLACLALTASDCRKQRDPSPLESLPPATKEGKGTFGCLIDGKAFTPKGYSMSSNLVCFYQYIDDTYGKGFYFGLNGSDLRNPSKIYSVRLDTYLKDVRENTTYPLRLRGVPGEAAGEYNIYKISETEQYTIQPPLKGELHITFLDEERQIVAGTFWFDAVNEVGEKVEVREGRFDVRYTR